MEATTRSFAVDHTPLLSAPQKVADIILETKLDSVLLSGMRTPQREVINGRETSTARLVAFLDAVFAVIITIMVSDLKSPAQLSCRRCFLCGPLRRVTRSVIYLLPLFESTTPSTAICSQRNAEAYVVEFCASVLDFIDICCDCLGSNDKTCGGPLLGYAAVFVITDHKNPPTAPRPD